MKILIIDDEPGIRISLGYFIRSKGHEVLDAPDGEDGLRVARKELPDVVFLDQRLPDMEGDSLLPLLASPEVGSRVIIMTAYVEIDRAVAAMKNGAEYYFPKPLDLEQVSVLLEQVEQRVLHEKLGGHSRTLTGADSDKALIGNSPQMIGVRRLIGLLAQNRETPALILGESGSGKELVAREIHSQSGCTGPLVEINCASLQETLLETELFGHEKGAFTDARATKAGLFEVADGGTIFLDEIAETPAPIQAKLLKVLDSRTFRRVGGITDIKTSARFVAATNKDLAGMVKAGLFRKDLFYRLNVLPVIVAPLRERGKDISVLAAHFARYLSRRMGRGDGWISPAVGEILQGYRWPGNVRELKNVIERALILAAGNEIRPEHLPPEICRGITPFGSNDGHLLSLRDLELNHIKKVLAATGNNHSRTAAILGISRSTLIGKLKSLDGV